MDQIINFIKRPIVERAAFTFAQAFLAVLLVGGFKLDQITLTAAIAAGLSALKTFALVHLEARKA